MLGRKKKLAALALVATLVLSGVNPVTTRAAEVNTETTITITKDMVDKNGEVTLKNVKAEEIIVPADAGVTRIIMRNVVANEMTVEEGALCDMKIIGSLIDRMNIADQEAKELTLRDMAKMIADGKTKEEAQKEYQQAKKEQAAKAAHTPVIELSDEVEVGVLHISGNNVKLAVDGFNGELEIEHKSESKTEQGVIHLEMTNSNPKKADISGDSNGTIVITGVDTALEEVVLAGSAQLILDVETKKLETAKESEGVSVQVLASVEEAVIYGAATEIIIAENVIVKKAEIKAEDVVVEGDGVLESAAVSSESVKVTTEGTNVFVPTPTPRPTVPPTPMPTLAPNFGGSGSGSGSGSGNESGSGDTPVQDTVTIPMDSSYQGSYEKSANDIPASTWAKFDGNVTVIVEYVVVDPSEYAQFTCIDVWGGWIAIPNHKSASGWTGVNASANSTTIILDKSHLDAIVSEGKVISFQSHNMYITKVTLRDECPDDYYVGDWGSGYEFSAADIAKYTGDVSITLKFRTVSSSDEYLIVVYEPLEGWPKLLTNAFTSLEHELDDARGIIDFAANDTSTTMVVSAATIE